MSDTDATQTKRQSRLRCGSIGFLRRSFLRRLDTDCKLAAGCRAIASLLRLHGCGWGSGAYFACG